jgi:hypothetical protein
MELRLSFLRIIVARAMDLMADRRYAALLGDPREKASQHKAPYAALRETVPRLIVLSIPKSSPAFTYCGRVLLQLTQNRETVDFVHRFDEVGIQNCGDRPCITPPSTKRFRSSM